MSDGLTDRRSEPDPVMWGTEYLHMDTLRSTRRECEEKFLHHMLTMRLFDNMTIAEARQFAKELADTVETSLIQKVALKHD